MAEFIYYSPTDIGSAFRTYKEVGEFCEFMIDEALELQHSSNDLQEWISPIVYSRPGKAFNIHYNFLVMCLSKWLGEGAIENDFLLTDSADERVVQNAFLLIVGILENYYEVVRVRQKTIDISKFKTTKFFNIQDKFYNVIVIKYGKNFKRFSAIPFSASAVKKLISAESYNALIELSDKDEYEQVAFGSMQVNAFIQKNGINPDFVTS